MVTWYKFTFAVHQFQSSDTCYLMAKEVIPADKRIIAANFSNLCLAKKEMLRYFIKRIHSVNTEKQIL